RDRQAPFQDQVPAGGLRTHGAGFHAAAVAAHGGGARWTSCPQAKLPPPYRAAGPGRGDRGDDGRNRRPPGETVPLPPRRSRRTRHRRDEITPDPRLTSIILTVRICLLY